MHFKEKSKQKVVIALSEAEAGQILATIKEHGEELGDTCEELGSALESAGVQVPPPPDHTRYEFAGPNE